MNIIGEITTKPMNLNFVGADGQTQERHLPSETYSVIAVIEQNAKEQPMKFYVTNQWYDEAKGKRLIIAEAMVLNFKTIKNG